MCKRLSIRKAGDWVKRSASARTDDHIRSAKSTDCSVRKCCLQSPGLNKSPEGGDEFCSSPFVVIYVHVVQARYHLAFAVTHLRHIEFEIFSSYAELFTSANVRRNLRTVNDVLAWQAGDVGTRSTNIFAFDHCHAPSFTRKGPRSKSRARAIAEDHKIVLFHSRILAQWSRSNVYQGIHVRLPLSDTSEYDLGISRCQVQG